MFLKMFKHFALLAILLQITAEINCATFEEDTTLTKQQALAFNKLKRRILPKLELDYQKEDPFVLRYLKAKNFDVNRAEEYILRDMKWRKDNHLETIHDEDWSDMEREYGMRVEGSDLEGRPILTWEMGDWEIRKAAIAGKMPRLLRWTYKNYDAAWRKIRELQLQGKNVTRYTMLVDAKNFNAITNVNPASIPFFIQGSLDYDIHFPFTADTINCLNTPALFQTVLTLIKPGLTLSTRDALKGWGKDWFKQIGHKLDRSTLPQRYGGFKEDHA